MRFTLIALTLVWLPATLANDSGSVDSGDSPDHAGEPDVEEGGLHPLETGAPSEGGNTDDEKSMCNAGGSCVNWLILGPIHYVVALLPTLWRASAGDGLVWSSSKNSPPRGFVSDPNMVGHTSWGIGAGLFIAEWNWEGFVEYFRLCTPRVRRYFAALLQSLQTFGMVATGLIYPAYNLKKRYEASLSGYYETCGKPVIVDGEVRQIFFDGSFYSNYTDWTIGLSAALLAMIVLIGFTRTKLFAQRGVHDRNNSRCTALWIRNNVHRPALVLVMIVIALVAGASIVLGAQTIDNKAYSDPEESCIADPVPSLQPTEDLSDLSV